MIQARRSHRLGCVIVTHNRAGMLRTCLSRALRQDIDLVVVIDNASSDETPDLLAKFQSEERRLVVERQRRNRGGAWGFARGMRLADRLLEGKGWLLLFDDDSWPEDDCIARFHHRVADYRKECIVAVGAAVFASDGQAVEANRPVLNLFRHPVRVLALTAPRSCSFRDLYHVPRSMLRQGGKRIDVDSISFVGLFLDLEALPLRRARYPRGALFIYSDDTVYTLELGRRGCRAIVDTDLVFCHETCAGGAASATWLIPAWKHYFVVRNSFLLNRTLSGLWFGPLCLATVLIHLLKGLRFAWSGGDLSVLAMVSLGIRDGLCNCYSRSLSELEMRCLRAGRWRLFTSAPTIET